MLGALMIPLILSTLFSASFAIGIRFAQTRRADMTVVGAVNYLTAAAFHAVLVLATGVRTLHATSVLIGVGGGITYASAFFLLQALMERRGVSVTAAVTRLSILVPVGVSIIAWRESATALQAAGIGMAVVSLPLLSIAPAERRAGLPGELPAGHHASPRRAEGGERRPRGASVGLLAGLFVVNGLCLLSTRAFRQTGVQGEDALFLLFLFSAASLTSCAVWFSQGRTRGRARARSGTSAAIPFATSALPGLLVGLCNALSNRFIVLALQRLPGIIVYPFYSAVGLLLTVALTRVLWKEKMGVPEGIGMALAVGSIVLVNL
jgi:multidrug transporter EmrE-like cation transporter